MNTPTARRLVGSVATLAGAYALAREGLAIPALGAAALCVAVAGATTALRTLPRAGSILLAALSAALAVWLALGIHEHLRGERADTGPDPTIRLPDPPGVRTREAWPLATGEGALVYRGMGPHAVVQTTGVAEGRAVALENPPTAPRAADATPGPLRFAVWGDCRGGASVFERMIDAVRARKLAWSVGLGDLVGMARVYQFEIVRDRLARTEAQAFLVPGNHDLDPFGTLRPYARVFGALDWSFVDHGTLFVGLDTAVGVIAPADVAWLETTVREHGALAPRVVLFCHHPLWMPASHDEKPLPEDDATGRVKALCESVGATVFCSHFHGYDDRTVGRVRQVTTGGAGARLEGEGPYHFVAVEVADDGLRIERVDLGGPELASPRLDRLLTFRDEGAYAARHDPWRVFLVALGLALALGGLLGALLRRGRTSALAL